MLPKAIYEPLPLVYLTTGILLVLSQHSILAYISGMLIYIAGALIWVARSNNRRQDQDCTIRNSRRVRKFRTRSLRPIIPERAYEYLPFVYIGIGLLAVTQIDSAVAYFSAVTLWLAGGLILLLRRNFRRT